MIPVVLGAITLGAVGYGVNKLLTNDEFRDDTKDKIHDAVIKGYEGLETLEEKMGLNEFHFPIEKSDDNFEDNKITTSSKEINQFDKLYELKVTIREKLLSEYKLTILDDIKEIKKDNKTKNINISEMMYTNLSSYEYLLHTAYSKIKYNMDNKTDTDIGQYIYLLKDIFRTKIIKKGKLNDKSSDLIIKGMHVVLGQKKPIETNN